MKHFLCLLAGGLLSQGLLAQSNENWTEVNLAVTDNQVIPAYADFAAASASLSDAGNAFCAAPDESSLSHFREQFHASMDAWQGIQHIQFGPITYFNWNYRVHYWPDEKGTGGRQLDALIAGKNSEVLVLENFARESVGVQGFPALERLLFADDSLQALQSDQYRCQVTQTIAANISDIASGVHSRWVEEFRTTVANADDRGFFENAEDATIDFLKAQVESVRRVQQQKVEEIIGESAGQERVRRAESWRSGRSLRNLRVNVAALATLFNGNGTQATHLGSVLLPEDEVLVAEKFAILQSTLKALPDSFEEALAAEAGYASLQLVAAQLDTVFETLEASLKNTDLYLGFNSLDGD